MNNQGTYVPLLSKELADYLKKQYSADNHLRSNPIHHSLNGKSENFMLGYLAGLSHAQQVLDLMLSQQEAQFEDPNDGDPTAGYFIY